MNALNLIDTASISQEEWLILRKTVSAAVMQQQPAV